MKNTFTLAILMISAILSAQDCDPFTTSHELVSGQLKQTILRGENGLINPLYLKTGIGPFGDIDTRIYKPLISSRHTWAGGLTPSGNIKLAAGYYDQQDWRPGPLDIDGITNTSICNEWNRIWNVTIEDIIKAREVFLAGGSCDQIPESILHWPGKNNPHLAFLPSEQTFADFWDGNLADGVYNPCDGDLPLVGIGGCQSFGYNEMIRSIPSEFSYYVMNDNGAPHSVSQANPTQLEIHVYSFTLKSQEAEGIIFFKHHIVNKASEDIRDYKLGQWIDFDMGCPENDKLGSNENHQMIYAYNGSTEENCGENSLVAHKAMVGYTYIRGPRGPYVILEGANGQDSLVPPPVGSGDFDTLLYRSASNANINTDCFDITNPNQCTPQNPTDFYNSLLTRNFDGSPIYDPNGIPSQWLFNGNPAKNDEWSLCTDQSIAETTGIISLDKLLMQPWANNEVISAIYYTDDVDRDCPYDASILYKDDVVQGIFDNCLYQHFAPLPPEIDVLYSEEGVTIDIHEIPYNYQERVLQAQIGIHTDRHYQFEGIKIYQVASENFDMSELNNTNVSVLVYQGDLDNDITDISNYKSDYVGPDQTWIEETKVSGSNNDIVNELSLTYDYMRNQPIDQSDQLYYVAIAYGYNNYEEFDPMGWVDNDGIAHATGQQYRYIESNCGLKTVSSQLGISLTSSPFEMGRYEFIYHDNTINLFEIEEELSLKLLTLDGKSLEQWNAMKGESFTSIHLGDHLQSGLYILNVTAIESGLNGSHKLVVVR